MTKKEKKKTAVLRDDITRETDKVVTMILISMFGERKSWILQVYPKSTSKSTHSPEYISDKTVFWQSKWDQHYLTYPFHRRTVEKNIKQFFLKARYY